MARAVKARAVKARALDRRSSLPLWAQLEADLRRRLAGGAFDERFPGELDLVDEYEVSRHTVREALRRLRLEGVLDSGRGRGTWVRKPKIEQPIGALYSLFASVEAMGLEQRSTVRSLEVRRDGRVAERLGQPPGTEFVYLERLRLADGEPLALDHAWLPRSLAHPLLQADFSHSGLYDELARLAKIRLTGGSEVITAVVPTAAQRALLAIPAGVGAFVVERRGCLNDRPVEWRESLIRSDRFSVVTQWSAQEGYRMDVAGGAPTLSALTPPRTRRSGPRAG